MTHTEESLMALAQKWVIHRHRAWLNRNAADTDACEVAHAALSSAIREVLAERDRLFASLIQMGEWRDKALERAEKAEAECELLRKDGERYEWIEGRVNLYGNNWAFGVMRTAINRNDGPGLTAAIDAAIERERK